MLAINYTYLSIAYFTADSHKTLAGFSAFAVLVFSHTLTSVGFPLPPVTANVVIHVHTILSQPQHRYPRAPHEPYDLGQISNMSEIPATMQLLVTLT